MNYKDNVHKNLILIIINIYIILFLFFIVFSYIYKIPKYTTIHGVVVKNGLIEILVKDSVKNLIYKNSYIYLDNKKNNYKIEEVILNAYRKDNISYHVFYINCNTYDYIENDPINLIFRKNNIKVMSLFETIWKGE